MELIYPHMYMLLDKIYFLELIYPHMSNHFTFLELLFGINLSSNVHVTRHYFYLEPKFRR